MSKEHEFASMITSAISDMVSNPDSEFHISVTEENLTDFIHALGNLAPNLIYQQITGDEKNNLEFNHLMNQLCFQYSKKQD